MAAFGDQLGSLVQAPGAGVRDERFFFDAKRALFAIEFWCVGNDLSRNLVLNSLEFQVVDVF